MSYSPYQKSRSRLFQSPNQKSKGLKYFYIALSLIIGITVVWFLQSIFSKDPGTSIYATFQKSDAIAESQQSDIGIWSAMLDNSPITEGDTIHIKEGNSSKIILPDSSFFSLAENTQLTLKSLRKTEENALFGEVIIERTPLLFSGKSDFDTENEFKIFLTKNIYVSGGKNTFYVDNNVISFIDGENIWVSQLNDDGKITKNTPFGVGQSFDITTFSLIPTESRLQSAILVAQYKGEEIQKSIAEETLEETETINKPILLTPEFEDTAVIVKKGKQKISGTTDLSTNKIVITFLNGTATEELSFVPSLSSNGKEKEWSYTASKLYDTLLPGINTYKIYAVNEEKQRSPATILLLSYDETANDDDEDTKTEDTTDDSTASEETINFAITAPNQGRDTEIEGDTIILNGTAGKNVAYITVSNITLDSSYTLQQYKKGQKTWKYWVDELQPDTYKYIVYAKNEEKEIISTKKITITLTSSSTPTPTPTSSPEESDELHATQTPKPVVTTGETSEASPTATPKPTITSSTSEISR